MKKIVIIAALLLTIVATSFAAPVKMIREDRVWEYIKETTLIDKTVVYEQFQMKFDGTEIVNGKTYHKLVYTGAVQTMTEVSTANGRKSIKIKKAENTNKIYYLMREENGKVYTYLDRVDGSQQRNIEHLSYDFNLKKGDKFDGLAYYDMQFFDLSQFEDAKIDSIGEALIDGETCKVQVFSDFGVKACKKTATEGIGFNYGILPAMDGVLMYASGGLPLIRLNRVYNGKGEVIYRGYDKTLGDQKKPENVTKLIVRPDRRWEYHVVGKDPWLERMEFTDSVEFNGRTYHRFTKINDIWDHNGERSITRTDSTRAYMREEGAKVYVLTDRNLLPVVDLKKAVGINETKVYDFSVGLGDSISCYGLMGANIFSDVKVRVKKEYEDLEILGRECKGYRGRLTWGGGYMIGYDFQFIEGMGMIKRTHEVYEDDVKLCSEPYSVGYLYMPDYTSVPSVAGFQETGSERDKPVKFGYHVVDLYRIYNKYGHTIYQGGKTHKYFAVSSIYDDNGFEIRVTEDAIRVAAEGNVGVTVWSMQGSKVAGAEGVGEVSVSTSCLIPGVYVVRAASADGRSVTRKIVVK